MWALELVSDPGTRQPLGAAGMAAVKSGLMQRGVVPMVVANRIHVVPPCVITPGEVAQVLQALEEVLATAD